MSSCSHYMCFRIRTEYKNALNETPQTHQSPVLSPCKPQPSSRIKYEVPHSGRGDDEKGHGNEEDGVVIHPWAMFSPHFYNHCHLEASPDLLKDFFAFQIADHNGNCLSRACKETKLARALDYQTSQWSRLICKSPFLKYFMTMHIFHGLVRQGIKLLKIIKQPLKASPEAQTSCKNKE